MSFAAFTLPSPLADNLAKLGFAKPTEVQSGAIPMMLAGDDLMVKAATGTGKTAAFLLPMLARLVTEDVSGRNLPAPRALVLVPTRELCQQVYDAAKALAKGSAVRIAQVYGGVPLESQLNAIKGGVDLMVATPGRLLDHLKKRTLRIDTVSQLVFDEADRMLDMGFEDEIRALVKKLAKARQTALFSATLGDNVWQLAKSLMDSPKLLEIAAGKDTKPLIEEQVYQLDSERKFDFICHLLGKNSWSQVLVFSRTKEGADKLTAKLVAAGHSAVAMHADLSQRQREQNLADFKAANARVLVATDVAARGLDIQALPCIINVELPFKKEDYVHRIGRTGRAGSAGLAISLLDAADEPLLVALEHYLDRRLPQQWYPGFEPDLSIRHERPRSLSKAAQKQKARKRALAKR
ncbi:DEAD/DEAH box helicase [Shewanella zhangzhouensis]|uniref:DEAD/DEAH box helicase n=1 Tax=Shewanella zhangzhouensis TaxID=2864213 RepID=UPI001C658A62|nr:DEAD/DEAH box helicase [Shewanella zhangzhouensis]QYK04075.1 DEAD/DEAH box helicase [Shewanella zhangzhouensis]